MQNQIPHGWKKVKLEEITLFIGRGFQPSYDENGLIVINQKCIRDGKVDLSDARFNNLSRKPVDTEKFLKNYDILINSTGTGTVGRVGQVLEPDQQLSFDSHVTLVRPNQNKVDGRFLGYKLWQREGFFEHLAEGSTNQVELGRESVKNTELLIPPILQQRKISFILSTFDDKIELNNKIEKNLEQMAQSIFKEWFISNNTKSNNGTVNTIANITSGKRPEKLFSSPINSFTIPVYGAKEIMGYTNKSLFDSQIILTGRVGTIGKVRIVNNQSWPSDNVLVITPKNDIYFHYLFFILRRLNFQSFNRGSSQPLITQGDISNYPIHVPDKDVAQKFENMVSKMFALIDKKQFENQKLAQMRDLLLPKLMKGEIRV